MEGEGSVWQLIEKIVTDEGLQLFDLELPTGDRRVLKILITKPNSKRTLVVAGGAESEIKVAGVSLGDCARINRRISDVLDTEVEIAGGSYVLEVSSPGINRKLRRPEHFIGAVGERVKMTVDVGGEPRRQALGKIIACNDSQLELDDEERKAKITVPLSAIEDARVDFLF